MKVAYVLGTTAGGTGTHVAMLAEACAGRGMPVRVFGPAQAGRRFFPVSPAPEAPAGSPALEDPPGSPAPARSGNGPAAGQSGSPAAEGKPAFVVVDIADRPRPVHDLAAVLRLRRLLRAWAPDIVHAHGLRAGALTALALPALVPPAGPGRAVAGRRRRPALVVTIHNAPPAGGIAGLVYAVLERIAARRAEAVTWVSADLAARMRRAGASDGGRALVPAPQAAPPSAGQIAAARASLGGQHRPVVLAAGRLVPQKGYPVLLAAAARWQDRDPVPLLVIAGDGPLAGSLAGQARGTGASVRFLGQRGDIPALLGAADVVVVPSRWEGQPLIVQEALRAGRPIVASRAGGIPDLTGEDAALFVPPGDPVALAAAVASVLDDPGLAAKLAAAATRRAADLPDAADAVDSAVRLYRLLVEPANT